MQACDGWQGFVLLYHHTKRSDNPCNRSLRNYLQRQFKVKWQDLHTMLKPNIENRTPFSPTFSLNPHLFPVGTNMYVVYPPISVYIILTFWIGIYLPCVLA